MTIQGWQKAKAISQKGTGRTIYKMLRPGEKIPNWPPDSVYKTGETRWRVSSKLILYCYQSAISNGFIRVPKMITSIRVLKSGESVPLGKAKRYFRGDSGYVYLRWKIGLREYVEVREHRIVDGKVVHGIRHHKNRIRSDNDPGNLETFQTTADHAAQHRKFNYSEISNLYQGGLSTVQIAQSLRTYPANISRILKNEKTPVRFGRGKPAPNKIKCNENEIVQLLTKHDGNVMAVTRTSGLGRMVIRRIKNTTWIHKQP